MSERHAEVDDGAGARISRRHVLRLGLAAGAGLGLGGILAACAAPTVSQQGSQATAQATPPKYTGALNVFSSGGTYQKAQTDAFFAPYAKKHGVALAQGSGPSALERPQSEVQTGKPAYDLQPTNQIIYTQGSAANLWQEIDYSLFRPEDLKALSAAERLKYGVGTIYYATNMAISTKQFPDSSQQPSSWVDFWDVKKFPGKRALPKPSQSGLCLAEAALVADGVPFDKLYPIDMDRAISKIKQLAPDVIWFTDAAQPSQLLLNGEVVMAIDSNGRDQVLIDQGAPLKIIWNGARRTFDLWTVLKGAPNAAEAMRFIAFASQPEQQAKMAELTGYAPTNPLALDLLSDTAKRKMVTYPANQNQTFLTGYEYWAANQPRWTEKASQALGL